jgi:holo-[acyl-carrier protein] synthase
VNDERQLRVGIDLVDVARMERVLARRPRLADRVFTDAERSTSARSAARLAARFAAKEATMKALGVGLGAFALREVEVLNEPSGRPRLALHGRARDRASALGIDAIEVSLSHTASLASAVVIAGGP